MVAAITHSLCSSLLLSCSLSSVLYLVIPLNFSLPRGSLSFSFFALLVHLKLAVWLYTIARRQQQEELGQLPARSLLLDLIRARAKEEEEEDEIEDDIVDSHSSEGSDREEEAHLAGDEVQGRAALEDEAVWQKLEEDREGNKVRRSFRKRQ
jgi:hypothetical protein